MPARLIGAHMPTAGGLHQALRRGHEIGCTAVQVFTNNPRQWKPRELSDEAVEAFESAKVETGIRALVSHDSYLVNLAALKPEVRGKSIDTLKAELLRCAKLGIPLVVSHMGAHMEQGEEEGLRLVAEGAREVLADTPDEVALLMETTAGQGSCLNWRFEQLATVLDRLAGPDRLGVCLDTCHVYAAGYDLRADEGCEECLSDFDRLIGVERIRTVHCNDSKRTLGSRVDRHEHLGKGELGECALRRMLNDPRFENVPFIAETPEAESMHGQNVAYLWQLSGRDCGTEI